MAETKKNAPKPRTEKPAKVAAAPKAKAPAAAKPAKVAKPKAEPTAKAETKAADGSLIVTGAGGKASGQVKLAPSVFELRPNDHLLYEAV